jgi:hypothetical protein
MSIHDRIQIVSHLQQMCWEIFATSVQVLKTGISEYDYAELLRKEFKKKKIVSFWYDVPIFVLFGTTRFLDIASKDYQIKSPHKSVFLQEGDPIYIDFHPQDADTKLWGDWNSMVVFHPRVGRDDEQIAFLEEVRDIQRKGFLHLRATMNASDIANYYVNEFEKHDIILSDVRNNVGHSMHSGPKLPEKRLFLENGMQKPLGDEIYAIEPGGYRKKRLGKGIVVGRFEECVLVTQREPAIILGSQKLLPLVI